MTSVLANRSAADRPATDFYPTPPAATEALYRWMTESGMLNDSDVIWEPACGQGHIAEVFTGHGHRVVATDLYDGSYGEGGVDFLTAPVRAADHIITNPPFIAAAEFVQRMAEHRIGGALLLKSQYWHAATRRNLFASHRPTAVLPLTWRPDFLMGSKRSAPTMDVLWTVWTAEPATRTDYQPLSRPEGI